MPGLGLRKLSFMVAASTTGLTPICTQGTKALRKGSLHQCCTTGSCFKDVAHRVLYERWESKAGATTCEEQHCNRV